MSKQVVHITTTVLYSVNFNFSFFFLDFITLRVKIWLNECSWGDKKQFLDLIGYVVRVTQRCK
jgi:hypothetical protein